jgi:hypothetical protein
VVIRHGDRDLDYDLDGHHAQWVLYQWGSHSADDGQAYIGARLARVLPDIADWAASLPRATVLLDPWLAPLRSGEGGGRTDVSH